MMGLAVFGGALAAIIVFVAALAMAIAHGGPRNGFLLIAGVFSALWLLQAAAIARLPDCSLTTPQWLKGVFVFSPACEISTANVEPDMLVGFTFRPLFAGLAAILSLPALLFAYRYAKI